jgi:hypothetical protein
MPLRSRDCQETRAVRLQSRHLASSGRRGDADLTVVVLASAIAPVRCSPGSALVRVVGRALRTAVRVWLPDRNLCCESDYGRISDRSRNACTFLNATAFASFRNGSGRSSRCNERRTSSLMRALRVSSIFLCYQPGWATAGAVLTEDRLSNFDSKKLDCAKGDFGRWIPKHARRFRT